MWKRILKLTLIVGLCTIIFISTYLAVLYRPICLSYNYTEQDLRVAIKHLYSQYNYYHKYSLSNEEYKARVDNELNTHNYKLVTKDLSRYELGGFSANLINTIYIDDDLNDYNFCKTLTHEILHWQTSSSNERYINYLTFKTLYNSNDPELKNVGIRFGITKLEQTTKNKYWCKDLIINYLRKEKE